MRRMLSFLLVFGGFGIANHTHADDWLVKSTCMDLRQFNSLKQQCARYASAKAQALKYCSRAGDIDRCVQIETNQLDPGTCGLLETNAIFFKTDEGQKVPYGTSCRKALGSTGGYDPNKVNSWDFGSRDLKR